MEMVKVPCQSLQDDEIFYDMWPRNKWGIPEAPRTEEFIVASPGDIDILLVPGLGFDRKGGRLGELTLFFFYKSMEDTIYVFKCYIQNIYGISF